MKLNLGCGKDVREGYVNVDLLPDSGRGIVACDLSVTPWPWKDESVDEILMLDFLEHFPYRKTFSVLGEVWRILKPEGFVDIQVPDFEECGKAMMEQPGMLCNGCGYEFTQEHFLSKAHDYQKCRNCGLHIHSIAESAMWRLYGGQDYAGNWHYTAFTLKSLILKLTTAGFGNFQSLESEHQRKNWNLKIRACKQLGW